MFELHAGRYRLSLMPSGSGSACYDWVALNRWSEDKLEDAQGFFLYLRDLDSGALWSATQQPLRQHPEPYHAALHEGVVRYARSTKQIDSELEVRLTPEGDAEQRSLTLTNRSAEPRRIAITSCIEVALAHPMGDRGHPAFSKLFVQTGWQAPGVLVARRRPRAAGEHWPLLWHGLTGAPVSAWETDRLAFVGRGHDLSDPLLHLYGGVGNVLDPVLALRCELTLEPGACQTLHWWLGVAEDEATLAQRLARLPVECSASGFDRPDPGPALHHGFEEHGRSYGLHLDYRQGAATLPPMPWINVIANPGFGCLISETGAGYTWSRNSQANRLTPWSNDPVSDPHGEALYLRDDRSGLAWSPTPGPLPAPVQYQVRHGFGYSRFETEHLGITSSLRWFVDAEAPVRIARLSLCNTGPLPRSLSLFSYARLVLGTLPPERDRLRLWREHDSLMAAREDGDFADGIAVSRWIGGAIQAQEFVGERSLFIGAHRSTRNPQALDAETLPGVPGDSDHRAHDPCFGHRLQLRLEPGASVELAWLLGEAHGIQSPAAWLAPLSSLRAVDAAFKAMQARWADTLDSLHVHTPCAEIDSMVNGWLPYQVLSCRIWGRSAFYQSGGAWGYRDQLQDAGNLGLLAPQRTREQILLHAAHQFVEGDVLHWWHPEPIGRGIRTRFSDDLCWLPFVAEEYVRSTGDTALWDERVGFLRAELLPEGEDERYLRPEPSGTSASVYDHCCRALDRSLAVGAHGLPLMGTGDWNDGMNRVGRLGRGESVWMGFFLYALLERFAPLAAARGDTDRAACYLAHCGALREALEEQAWDGAWYRRAYYDDGTPLGTHGATECRIDGLAQAWSVLSGAVAPERARQAMRSADAQLVDEQHDLIRLLTPPFQDTPEDPGYIKGYVAGVRENGGQYTHAASWFIAATAALGERNRAAELLRRLAPRWHTRSAEALARYKLEPYVIAADVYGSAPHEGRGGWSWYTGSAGWVWRLAVESILGLRLEGGDTLVLQPCVPDHWPHYAIDYRLPAALDAARTRYRIEVDNPDACSARILRAEYDGAPLAVTEPALRLPLAHDGGAHLLRIWLGA